ncbi:LOW QUALITY PROTEIN: major facilitator superfamily domain-containing protein 6-like [Chanos chanos]|uniref:LOW QUALITY PROTEIN: major facilitator superfamily domain-containing protein 6-like n=1 Tax=Chanos chanos TaxID=29144 RepID=A0A6J2WZL0_CHACN|nr:LOW QUALITY PROTEIN: major facilitator superfamily domain-containing protein 6-like [Chanos chanos]
MKRVKQWDIRGAVALAGTFHFLYSCGTSFLLPFLTLYLRHLGLTASMTGIVIATKHLVALVSHPLSSLLAKHYNKRRFIVIGSLICSAGVVLTLLLLPPTAMKVENNSTCNVSGLSAVPTELQTNHTPLGRQTTPSQISAAPSSNKKTELPEGATEVSPVGRGNTTAHSSLQGSSETPPLHEHPSTTTSDIAHQLEDQEEEKEEEKERHEFLGSLKVMDVQHQLFFLVLIIVGLWEAVVAPLEWTVDDGLYEYLDFVDATDRYRSVGFWKLLGAAGGVCTSGVLVSSLRCTVGNELQFYAYALLMVLTMPPAALLPFYHRKRERPSSGGLKALQLVRGDSRALLCAVNALLVGVAGGAASSFLLWLVEDCGGTELHMGLALALALSCQAVFTLFGRRLGRFLKPHGRALILGTVGLSLQCFYYSFLWTPWAVVPAQPLAGLSTGILWWAVKAQSDDVATPGRERAVWRVYQTLVLELGSGLGSLIGGLVVQKFGMEVLFQSVAVTLSVWSVCMAILQWRIPHQRRINYSRLLAADASEASDTESEEDRDWLEKAMENDTAHANRRRSEC